MVATQICFIFTPIFCGDSHFDSHFSDGLVQPPTSNQPMSSKGFFFPMGLQEWTPKITGEFYRGVFDESNQLG